MEFDGLKFPLKSLNSLFFFLFSLSQLLNVCVMKANKSDYPYLKTAPGLSIWMVKYNTTTIYLMCLYAFEPCIEAFERSGNFFFFYGSNAKIKFFLTYPNSTLIKLPYFYSN